MKVYHWTDINHSTTYYTDKKTARQIYNRLARFDDPGDFAETEAVELLEQKDRDIEHERYIIRKLCGMLDRLVPYDISELMEEWSAQFNKAT